MLTERVGEERTPPVVADNRARRKCPQVQGAIVEVAARGRVGIEEHLKAPVEGVVLHALRAYPPTGGIAGFKEHNLVPVLLEHAPTRQTGNAAADDDCLHAVPAFPLLVPDAGQGCLRDCWGLVWLC